MMDMTAKIENVKNTKNVDYKRLKKLCNSFNRISNDAM